MIKIKYSGLSKTILFYHNLYTMTDMPDMKVLCSFHENRQWH